MMAVEKPTPVSVEARRLDVSILPLNFSIPLTDFLVGQNDDLSNVAGKANDAANGAYIAQLTNDEQDAVLAEHTQQIQGLDFRLIAAEATLEDHEIRITSNTDRLDIVEPKVSALEGQVVSLDSRITLVEGDYVSKSITTMQTLASPISVATSYSVGGIKVVGVRNTGWTAAGGTVVANKGVWNPNTLAAASATYSQAEANAVRQQLNATEARLKAIEQMARTHGLIN
jgi:hypothetical protein